MLDKLYAHEDLLGFLEHQTMVGSEVRLALHSIHDDSLGLRARRGHELHACGEGGTAHTYNAGGLDAVDDFLSGDVAEILHGHEFVRAVDGLQPFIAFDIHDDGHAACAARIEHGIDLVDLTADAGEDGDAETLAGLTQ